MIGPAVACNTSNITGFRGRCKGRIASIHRVSEKAHSWKLVVAIPATNVLFYSPQSTVTPGSCCVLPGYSHICCEDLLRGATGCYSPVAGELVLCSAARTTRS